MNEEELPDAPHYVHQSSKEDDDPILEFQSIETDHLEKNKKRLGKIDFHNATGKELVALTCRKIDEIRSPRNRSRKIYQVIPLDPYRLNWISRKKKFFPLTKEAFINLPAGAGIRWMSRMLKKEIPERVNTINYVMNLIRLAQAKEYTMFIVGSKDDILEKLTHNLRRSFPRLRIVGKHHGYLKDHLGDRLIEALRKTDPHIILLGMGYHREMRWISENKEKLGNSILVNVGGALDILAGFQKKAPDFFETRGLTWFYRALNSPARWHRLFFIQAWFFSVLLKRIFFSKNDN